MTDCRWQPNAQSAAAGIWIDRSDGDRFSGKKASPGAGEAEQEAEEGQLSAYEKACTRGKALAAALDSLLATWTSH